MVRQPWFGPLVWTTFGSATFGSATFRRYTGCRWNSVAKKVFAQQSAHVKCFRSRGGQEIGRSTIVEVYHLVCLAGGVLINKIIAQSYTTVCLAEWSRPTRVRRSTSCGQLNTQLCLAEWSKALALGANLFGGVGSNPTADILPRSAVTICLVSSVALFLSCQEVFWCSSQCLFCPESRLGPLGGLLVFSRSGYGQFC